MPESRFRFFARRRASIRLNQLTNSANASKCRRILGAAATFLGIAMLGAATLAAQVNFGSAAVGTTTPATQTVTLTYQNPYSISSSTIASISVLTQGVPNLDFTNAGTGTCATGHTLTVGQTCTVVVNFEPKSAGIRLGGVVLLNSAGAIIASSYLQGTGSGPQAAFTPAIVSTIATLPNGANQIVVDGAGNVYVPNSSSPNKGVLKYVLAGSTYLPSLIISFAGMPSGSEPWAIAVDSAGNVFVSDIGLNTLTEWSPSPSGVYTQQGFSATNISVAGITVDGGGNLYLSDFEGNIYKESFAGGYTQSSIGAFGELGLLGADSSGNLYLADGGNETLLKETLSGSTYTQSTIGYGNPPAAVDSAGNIYLRGNGLVKLVPSGGTYKESTILIPGSSPYETLAVDNSGNLYFTYVDVNTLYKASVSSPPSMSFASTYPGHTSTDSPQFVTVQNVGTQALSLSGISYPPDFPEVNGVSTDCTSSSSLTVLETCTFSIDFSPLYSSLSGTGTTLNESVTLTDNTLNEPGTNQSLSVNGTVFPSPQAAITSPAQGSTLPGSTVTFTWNSGTGVTQYALHVGTTGPDSTNIYAAVVAGQSKTLTNIPITGGTLYVRLYSTIGGKDEYNDFTYTEASIAAITSPTPGSSLTGPSATFSWTAGTNVTEYDLHVGTTGPNSYNLFGGDVTGQSKTLTNIPITGGTLYVRLYSEIGGILGYYDYTYTEANPPTPAVMTSPASGSTLTGSSATFSWTAGSQVEQYLLHVGTTGAGSNNIFSGTVTGQTKSVTGIPETGATLYVRLYSQIAGAWQYNDYTYLEAKPTPAAITSPTPGSTLPGSSATFTWTTGTLVTQYILHVGTTGAGSNNIFTGTVTGQSQSVTGIPATGGTLYVRLYSLIAGAFQYADYTYTEEAPPTPATMTSPTPGSTLTGSSATFSWTTGSQVEQYNLHIGTTGVGATNLFQGTVTGQTRSIAGIPTTGGTLYVRLYSLIAGAWQYIDYTYAEEAAPAQASMTSPAPGSTLSGSSATFSWTAGSQVTGYYLTVGTTGVGATDLFGGTVAARSKTITGIPTTGGTVYVTLYSMINGAYQYTNYTYTEQ